MNVEKQSAAKSQRKLKRKAPWIKWLQRIGLSIFIVFGGAAVAGMYMWMSKLKEVEPLVSQLEGFKHDLDVQPTLIKSADGKILYSIIGENRKWVTIDKIPDSVVKATLAAEDKRFYQHSGVDTISVVRQLVTNTREGKVSGGASTIPMQLAKRLFTSPEKSFGRKLQDAAIAVQIEKHYSKDYILEMYLNQVYYGSFAYGIKRAAEVYFGKQLSQLTVAEAATLARCVRMPSKENPYNDPEKSIANRNDVLRVMDEEGYISDQEYRAAIKEPLKLNKAKPTMATKGVKKCSYFVDYILGDVMKHQFEEVDFERGGYIIETTIDTRMQEIAEHQVKRMVDRFRGSDVRTGAFLLTDLSGNILAMAGGYDYNRNQYNVCTQGRRQPGSSFKPFVYAVALESHAIRQGEMLPNAQKKYRGYGGTYVPRNSNRKYGGEYSIPEALKWSINVPAVEALDRYGKAHGRDLRPFADAVQSRFGFKSKINPYLSSALGASEVSPLEMATGFSAFANHGQRFTPMAIKRIYRRMPGGEDEVIYQATPKMLRAISAETADFLDTCLRGVVTGGTAKEALNVSNSRGKTGTTSDNKDAWFIGYTDKLIGVSWIANEILKPGKSPKYAEMAHDVFGGTFTCQLWTAAMSQCQALVGESTAEHKDAEGRTRLYRSRDEENTPREIVPNDRGNLDDRGAPKEEEIDPDQEQPMRDDSTPAAEAPPKKKKRSTKKQPEEEPPPEETDPTPRTTVSKPNPKPAVKESPPKESNPPDKSTSKEEGGTVTVDVCAETGQLANSACPDVSSRTFRRGRQPKSHCRKHH